MGFNATLTLRLLLPPFHKPTLQVPPAPIVSYSFFYDYLKLNLILISSNILILMLSVILLRSSSILMSSLH